MIVQSITKLFPTALTTVLTIVVMLGFTGFAPASQAVDFTNPDATIIDVRTLGEWQGGHLDGAVRIEWQGIQQGVASLGLDKDQPINLYCRSGMRASRADALLKEKGYTQVHNMGGLDAAAKLTGAKAVR